MPLNLKCPSCSYAIAAYDSDANEYRIWIPNKRKLGDLHLFGPVRVTCTRCGAGEEPQTIPAHLEQQYLCPRGHSQLAKSLDTGDHRDGILVHLPSVENELFCANAQIQCQRGECAQWVDLNVLRDTGKGMVFEADYSHLLKSSDQLN